jgi:crossover junction endodeoxyribonuclease RuvC
VANSGLDFNNLARNACRMLNDLMSVIMGIDPGSRITGYGVLRLKGDFEYLESGIIDLRKAGELPERLALLNQHLDELFNKWQPEMVSIEKVFLGKNPQSAFTLGHARGICLAQASACGATVAEYATRSAKKAVSGRGSSSKEELQKIIEMQFGRKIAHLDATDALALAICHGRQVLERKVIQRAKGEIEL